MLDYLSDMFKVIIVVSLICIAVNFLITYTKKKKIEKEQQEKREFERYKMEHQNNQPPKSTITSIPKSKTRYARNMKSNVFHRPNCPCAKNMYEYDMKGNDVKNYIYSDYNTLIAAGYKPCNKCKPN